MKEVSAHIKGWINYLEDYRNCLLDYLLFPITQTVENNLMSSDEKIEKIKIIIENLYLEKSKLDPRDYGVILPPNPSK